METTNKKEQNAEKETSVYLSIPSCVSGATLKKLEEKDIKFSYSAVDESGNIIMRVDYLKWQEEHFKTVVAEMKESALTLNLAAQLGSEIFWQLYIRLKTAA